MHTAKVCRTNHSIQGHVRFAKKKTGADPIVGYQRLLLVDLFVPVSKGPKRPGGESLPRDGTSRSQNSQERFSGVAFLASTETADSSHLFVNLVTAGVAALVLVEQVVNEVIDATEEIVQQTTVLAARITAFRRCFAACW
jgi:hypothetical protein